MNKSLQTINVHNIARELCLIHAWKFFRDNSTRETAREWMSKFLKERSSNY
jgi:hypothetical protein